MDKPSGSVPEQVRQFAPKANGKTKVEPKYDPKYDPRYDPKYEPKYELTSRRDGPSDALLGMLQQISGMSNEKHERVDVPAARSMLQPAGAIPDQGVKPVPRQPPADDTIDKAGQALIAMLQKAAGVTDEEYEQATILAGRLAGDLRTVENRIKQLEAEVAHFRDRAANAEKWLQHISHVIEEQLLAPQAAPRKGPQ